MRITPLLAVAATTFTLACGSSGGGSATTAPSTNPGRAELTVTIDPNPIVARKVSGQTYDFPFTVVIRETAGIAVNIQRVRVDVRALGAIQVYEQAYGPQQIAQLGYPTSLGAGGELRYSFNPRREVPDERLFGSVNADLRVEAIDANGNQVTARTDVSVRQ